MITGRNGAGKTNLLEALYFACTGRSCRTANEREAVRFGAGLTRLELEAEDTTGRHAISVGFQPGEAKHLRVDGAPVERLTDSSARPLVAVFLPDRLELVLGAPALRRSHMDQVVAALWPARAAVRREYSAALAQRNALIASIRAGRGSRGSLPGLELGAGPSRDRLRCTIARNSWRGSATGSRPTRARSASRGKLSWRTGRDRARTAPRRWPPSSRSAPTATSSAASPATVRTATTCRCSATAVSCAPTGSRGQVRLGLLALLLAEREALADERGPRRFCCSTT